MDYLGGMGRKLSYEGAAVPYIARPTTADIGATSALALAAFTDPKTLVRADIQIVAA